MQLTNEFKTTLNETQAMLQGYARRHFMAKIVETVFGGKPSHAERELGWNRVTLRKARRELQGEFCYIDHYHQRGRKKCEARLPKLLPDHGRTFLYFTAGPVTSDFIVDCLLDCGSHVAPDFPEVRTLVLLQDNGPQNHSRRTQFMQRTIHLLYYPPYHSKYNPVERLWGRLEQHWNGDLLDSASALLNFAQTMTWQQQQPVVTLVQRLYLTGVRLAQTAMALLEQRLQRYLGLEKYFVLVHPLPIPLSG